MTADTPGRYLHGYSEATDPTGLTPFAAASGSPLVAAATGADSTLSVNLGGNKNVTTATFTRVLVVAAPSTLPSGITAVTVRVALAADPASGLQPITALPPTGPGPAAAAPSPWPRATGASSTSRSRPG